jgi:hypothetical protein
VMFLRPLRFFQEPPAFVSTSTFEIVKSYRKESSYLSVDHCQFPCACLIVTSSDCENMKSLGKDEIKLACLERETMTRSLAINISCCRLR